MTTLPKQFTAEARRRGEDVRFRLPASGALLFLLATMAAFAAPAVAQNAEVSTRDEPVVFKSGANLVSVPVVVRDARGRAVGSLEKEDFRLFEDGKPQIISRFSVERTAVVEERPRSGGQATRTPEGKPAPRLPDRFVAYVFDDLNMKPDQLVFVREAAIRHLSETSRPLERAAVYTTSGRTQVDFTDDIGRLKQALLTMLPRGGRSDPSNECPPLTQFEADRIVTWRDREALALGIMEYVECAGPIAGGADKMVENAARRVVEMGDSDAGLALDGLRSIVGKLATMPGQRSLLFASPGFLLQDGRRQQQRQLIEHAIRANVVVTALDARGLYTMIPGGSAESRGLITEMFALKTRYQRWSATAQSGVMADLASGTGGKFFENTNDGSGAFAGASVPEVLYVLGFVPANLKLDGKYHSLRVTLRKSKGVTVQARRGYYAPQYEADPAEQVKQQIEEAFFSASDVSDLPVGLQTQFFKTGPEDATLSVVAKLDLKPLPFRKEEDRNLDNVTMVAGLFDQNGNYISGVQKILEMRLRDETLARRLDSGYTIRTDFQVKPGTYMVRLVVRDSEGQLISAQTSGVEIP